MPYPPLRRSAWVPSVSVPAAKTAKPTITGFYDGGDAYYVTIRNNDDNTATVKYEINDSTPDLGSSSFITGQTKTLSIAYGTYFTPFSVYATAQATGEDLSDLEQYFYDP